MFMRKLKIAQFRIPGRTGASCIKLIKVRLMRGRNESMRALELVKHCCCALDCTISTKKTKNVEKYPEWTNVRCFPIVQDSEKKYYTAEIPERERRMRWIATCSCRLDSLIWFNVTRHTRICSIYFEGGLSPT